jgi:branched-chain amino acid aminotransferase
MPVTTLHGAPVADGRVGSRTTGLRDAYWARHADPAWTTPVRYGPT